MMTSDQGKMILWIDHVLELIEKIYVIKIVPIIDLILEGGTLDQVQENLDLEMTVGDLDLEMDIRDQLDRIVKAQEEALGQEGALLVVCLVITEVIVLT